MEPDRIPGAQYIHLFLVNRKKKKKHDVNQEIVELFMKTCEKSARKMTWVMINPGRINQFLWAFVVGPSPGTSGPIISPMNDKRASRP